MLPGAEDIAEELKGKVDHIFVDRMNYHYADRVYRKYGLENKLSDAYFQSAARALASACGKYGIDCNVVF